MSELKAISTVYSYYLPEVRDAITSLTRRYPHEVFLRSVVPGLDGFHEPIFDKLVAAHAEDVPSLGRFAYRYPTAGAEEGIREFLTFLAAGGVTEIYVWRGEYEGFKETARTRGIATAEIDPERDPAELRPGHWFLSNPSARDGRIVHPARILAICEAGHKLFYDLSYLGTTGPVTFDVSHPNVAAVAISFSKPYGLFYYRIGFTFSREAIPSLFANKWFKNVFGLLIAERLLDELVLGALARRYKTLQAEILERINREVPLGLAAGDAFLIAYLPGHAAARLPLETRRSIARFQRADNYRFCLTRYFEEQETRSR